MDTALFNGTDNYPLAPLQLGMLYQHLRAPNSGVDIQQIVMDLHHDLDCERFRRAWEIVVEKHEILRTRFRWEGLEEPLQEAVERVTVPFTTQDLRTFDHDQQRSALESFLGSDRLRGFDLQEPPLMRIAVMRLGDEHFRAIWTSHHILMDGRCYSVILKAVFETYAALATGATAAVEHSRSFREYVEFTRSLDLSAARTFWHDKLQGFTATTPLLPDKFHNNEASVSRQRETRVSSAATAALQELAEQEQLTLNAIIQGAWALLLSRYSGETDVLFGAVKSARASSVPEARSILGLMMNTLPVRVQANPKIPFVELARQLRQNWITLRPFEHTPLVVIKEATDLPSDSALFDSIIMFERQRLADELRALGSEWLHRHFKLLEYTGFALSLFVYAGTEITLEIGFSSDRYSEQMADRILGHLRTLLESIAENAHAPLSDLRMLTDLECKQILVDWNHTDASYPRESSLASLIEAQVETTPDAIAVAYKDRYLTYRDLNNLANQVALALRQRGAKPEQVVGVFMDRSEQMLVALLAIVKTGAAYLPLDPMLPTERLRYMVEDSGIRLLVTDSKEREVFGGLDVQEITVTDLCSIPGAAENLGIDVEPRNLAYILYTSGSTGKPKGVQVPRGALTNFLWCMREWLQIAEGDRWLAVTTISFDIAGLELWLPLLVGARVVLASRADTADGQSLLELIEQHNINFLQATPVTWRLMLQAGWTGTQDLTSVCGGEAMPPEFVAEIVPRVKRLWNVYGPTETTIWSTGYLLHDSNQEVLIGRPFFNTKCYILDAQLNPVPIGVVGELFIGGDGLARGYLNRPELTADRFLPDPFQGGDARIYRTGDLARFRNDGNIECLGRVDHQVKIRGFRVELGEIEVALKQHSGIKQAVAMAREDVPGDKRLVAYLVCEDESKPSVNDLREYLKNTLPDYMVPSAYVFLRSIPISSAGKIDRKSLPAPEQSDRTATESAYVPPGTELEDHLTEIWREVLGLDRIGIHDNFFEIGGHSLLAVRLFTRILDKLGHRLSLNTLFHAPTIARLAAVIEEQPDNSRKHSLVAIRENGSKPPFYWIPGGRAISALGFRDVSLMLGLDQPVYGFESKLPSGDERPASVEERATEYLKLLLRNQESGPYYLAGFCLGGYVAYEMAQRLRSRGEQVGLLVMINSYYPVPPSKSEKALYLLQRRRWQLTHLPLQEIVAKARIRSQQVPEDMVEDPSGEVNNRVMRQYRPQAYDGDVTLFISSDSDYTGVDPRLDPRRKWGELAKSSRVMEVPGGHVSLLEQPTIETFAARLRDTLAEAQNRTTEQATAASARSGF